jgi:cell wall assembly regulator SMI1
MQDSPEETVRQWRRLLELQRPVLPERCAAILPGASSAQLEAVEQVLGFALPEGYKAVLRESGGGMPIPNQPDMIDLERTLEDWAIWVNVAADCDEDVDGVDPEHLPKMKMRGAYCHARLISLNNESGHGQPMLDMSPGPAGRAGQVVSVWHGDGMHWHAWSLACYLQSFADAIEEGRVSYRAEEGRWVDAKTSGESWANLFYASEK